MERSSSAGLTVTGFGRKSAQQEQSRKEPCFPGSGAVGDPQHRKVFPEKGGNCWDVGEEEDLSFISLT